MRDWQALFSFPGFRNFWLALVSDSLGTWCVIATLPILVAEHFGAGNQLAISLGLRVLPRILLAPAAGAVLRRFAATRVAIASTAATGALTAALPWCHNFAVLQAAILAIGVADVFVIPSLLALRTPVTPRGLEMAGNTLFFTADRLAKFAGPAVAGLAVTAGFAPAYFAFGAAMLLTAAIVAMLPTADTQATPPHGIDMRRVLHEFTAMLRRDQVLAALLLCAIPYMLTFGAMRPFLFWANTEWFGASHAAWTVLLAAQGIGAIAGAVVSGAFSRSLLRAMSVYELALVASVLEGLSHVALLCATSTTGAVILLILSGIPEMLGYATYFTAIQQRLPPEHQVVFYSLQQPLLDAAFALGIASASLHATGVLSLGAYWAWLTIFSTLPPGALLALHLASGRAEATPLG